MGMEALFMRLSGRLALAVFTSALVLVPPSFAFDAPLSDEAVRQAYFLGQRNDQATFSYFSQYVRSLSAPNKGPYIAEVEIYTPYTQIIEASRRRSNYSAQQAELDYRQRHDKLYVRIRIDFTDTYGSLELYRSAKADRGKSADSGPLPDFYRDFRVGLSQRSPLTQEDRWVEPLHIILQSSYTQSSPHYPFVPEDLGILSYVSGTENSGLAYSGSGNNGVFPTGWLVWLVYDANDVASDDSSVEVITTDGQHVAVPFDLSRLR